MNNEIDKRYSVEVQIVESGQAPTKWAAVTSGRPKATAEEVMANFIASTPENYHYRITEDRQEASGSRGQALVQAITRLFSPNASVKTDETRIG